MSLNEDVLFQIMIRLPVKSLLRFRSVCKAWYALIKSSRFTYEHLAFQRATGKDERIIVKYYNYATRKDVVRLYADYESLVRVLNAPPPEMEIQGSGWPFDLVSEANGIFCLWNKYTISLMNPVLGEFRMIPDFCGRAFSVNPVGIGFAFDESTNDYKIVRIDLVIDDTMVVGALYSLSSNTWRELGRICILDSIDLNPNSCSVFVNGSIHWHAKGSSPLEDDPILAFNITTELFQEMHAPKQSQDGNSYTPQPGLFVLEKSFLALVSCSRSSVSSALLFTVWVMKEYGVADSWTKEYCIQTIPSIKRPLSFLNNDKLVFLSYERELICHDLPTGQLYQLHQFSSALFDKFGLMVFDESLISVS